MWPFRKKPKRRARRLREIDLQQANAQKGRIVRITVDSQGCCAHTLCVAACPQVFEMGPHPSLDTIARVRADAHLHFESAAAAIHLAARGCPVGVIRVETEPPS
jgi:ferredoxin